MTDKVRLNIEISAELGKTLEGIANSASTTRTEVIRQSLALMKIAHAAKNQGRHLGFVADPTKLDTEIVVI